MSDPHIPTDWFDKIQLTIIPNKITTHIEYTTKDGSKGKKEFINALSPEVRHTGIDQRLISVLDYFREEIQNKIERNQTDASTT